MLQPGRLFPEAARFSLWTLVWPFQGEDLIGDAIVEIAKARDQAHGGRIDQPLLDELVVNMDPDHLAQDQIKPLRTPSLLNRGTVCR